MNSGWDTMANYRHGITMSPENCREIQALREYAAKRDWSIVAQIKEVGSGASQRELRETLIAAARRREIDVVVVWRLDRWGRSVADLVSTLQELQHLGVGFVSLTEALDLTTPAGRAMAGLLAVFAEFEREILRERVRAGLAHARQNGKHSAVHPQQSKPGYLRLKEKLTDSVVRPQTNDQLLAETFWNHYHKDRDSKDKGVGCA